MSNYFNNIYVFVCVATLIQASLFALVFLCLQVRNKQPYYLLSAILLVFAMIKVHQLFFLFGIYQSHPDSLFLLLPFQWLLAPLIYFYILSRYNECKKLEPSQYAHFAPFLFASLYCLYSLLDRSGEAVGINHDFLNGIAVQLWWPVLQAIQQLLYIFVVVQQLNRQKRSQQNWHSNELPIDAKLLKLTSLAWVVVVFLDLLLTAATFLFDSKNYHGFFIHLLVLADYLLVNVLMVSALSLYMMQLGGVFKPAKDKKQPSPLSHEEMTKILDQVTCHLQQSKCYLYPELTLKEVSQETKIATRDISLAINTLYGNSFYYFVNDFRIQKAKHMLTESPKTKIIDVAYDVGFNSKSSFNKMFKHFTGHTPSGYKKVELGSN